MNTNKPRCCPDEGCEILFCSRHDDTDVGDSFDCYGRIPEVTFSWNGNEHKNDISHCTYTPLKGIIRYLENKDDQTLIIARLFRLLAMLGDRSFNLHWYFSKAQNLGNISHFKVVDDHGKVVELVEDNPHIG